MIEIIYISTLILTCFFFVQKIKNNQALHTKALEENIFLKSQIEESKSTISNAENKNKSRENSLLETIQNLQKSIQNQQVNTLENQRQFAAREARLKEEIESASKKLAAETEARKKVLSQKKSGEVRLGHIAETLAPFLDQFEFEPERCSFLGQPIDYISFGDDEITFIEVKSGNSQLSQKQRHIRDLVKQKAVSWKEIRIQ